MMTNYAVDDGDGNQLTAGLQEHNVRRVAQSIANKRGESVWYYQTGEGEADAESIEVKPEFQPTHIITPAGGEPIPVMLIDGAAYTAVEAESLTAADYERQENGDWTFQGQPFDGTVEKA